MKKNITRRIVIGLATALGALALAAVGGAGVALRRRQA